MAGIYLHIPFCKQACHYCDFHFSTSLGLKQPLLQALHKEIISRKNELGDTSIETVYFGGGTPSILEVDEIKKLLETIYTHYQVSNSAEITLEANPDDLTVSKLKDLKTSAINRFSIGIQSFFEEDLLYMNRAHSASEGERAIKASQDTGFENITIDLIYGTPGLTNGRWISNLRKSISFLVPHVSSYALTVEEKTPLASLIQRKKRQAVDDEQTSDQFYLLVEELTSAGFEHYEISNFAKEGYRSKHNSAYWHGKPYLGMGPGAHSFDGEKQRKWNISNNPLYIKNINSGEKYFETELLTTENLFNEHIMTHIRLAEGISLAFIEDHFGRSSVEKLGQTVEKWDKKMYAKHNNFIILTNDGKLISDRLAASLFVV